MTPANETAYHGTAHLLRIVDADGHTVGPACLVTETLAVTVKTVTGTASRVSVQTIPGDPGSEAPADIVSDAASAITLLRLNTRVPGTRPARFAGENPQWGRTVDAMGFPRGIDTGAWTRTTVRAVLPSGGVQLDPESGGYPLGSGFAGSAVHDTVGRVLGLIGGPDGVLVPAQRMLDIVARLAGQPGLATLAVPLSPFRGLAPYGESDAGVFPARGTESAAVAALLQDHRRIIVVGEPGCGKSSLISAGVVPSLRAQGYTVSGVRGSARAARPDDDSLAQRLRREAEANPGGRHLLVLDQVEEILAATGGEEALALLAASTLAPATRVVLVMRPDTWGMLLADGRYARLTAAESTYTLSPLDRDALRTVLSAAEQGTPATYEDGLSELILQDLEPVTTPLPLLGYLMERLWDRCWTDSRQAEAPFMLTYAAYHALGGVAGAIRERAEKVWVSLTPEEQDYCRGLLRRLVHIPDADMSPVRRAVSRSDLDAGQWQVAQRLVDERLLAIHGDDGAETVEVVHEILMRQWDRYTRWIDEDRAFLLWRARLSRDIDRWENNGRADTLLPGDAALDEADAQKQTAGGALDDREREYLAAGQAARRSRLRARRVRRGGLAVISAAFTVLLTLGAFGIVEARQETAIADSQSLVRESQDLQETNSPLSVMTALAAFQVAPTRDSRNQLMRTYWNFRDPDRLVASPPATETSWKQSRDGDVAIEVSDYAVDVQTRIMSGPLKHYEVALTKQVEYAELASDGRRVAVFYQDGGGAWFDIDAGPAGRPGPVQSLPGTGVPRTTAKDSTTGAGQSDWSDGAEPAISADGRYAAAQVWGRIVIWNLAAENGATVARRVPVPATVKLSNFWFAAGSKSLIAQVDDRFGQNDLSHLTSISMATGTVHRITPTVDDPTVSSDGSTAVTCQAEGKHVVYQRFSLANGKREGQPLASSASPCTTPLTVGAAGRFLYDGENLIDLDRGTVLSRPGLSESIDSLFEYGGKLYGATSPGDSFSSADNNAHTYINIPWSGTNDEPASWSEISGDGTRIYSVLRDGRLSERSLVPGTYARELAVVKRLQPTWGFQGPDHLEFNSSGKWLLEREGKNVVTVRDARTLKLIRTITTRMPRTTQPQSEVLNPVADPGPAVTSPETASLMYHFDGNDVVTISDTVVQRWNVTTGKQITRLDITRYKPKTDPTNLTAGLGPHPGTIAVVDVGEPGVIVIDLASGRVTGTIRTPDTIGVQFDPSGRYMALLRSGSILELWRLNPPRKVIGPLPSIVESTDVPYVAGFTGDNGRYYLGTRNTLSVYGINEGGLVDSYDFADPTADEGNGAFMDVTKNLSWAIRIDSSGDGSPLSLNPATWREQLCKILGGRDFTDQELAQLSGHLRRGQICGTNSAPSITG